MNGQYVDHKEFDGIDPNEVNRVLEETDWDAYDEWWNEQGLPQGLRLVLLHTFPTTRAYCEQICEDYNIENPSQTDLLKMAITVDSMIS